MTAARLPSVSDVIRWYGEAGLKPVVTIDYGARRVTVRPQADNDAEKGLEPSDPLADDIDRVMGGG